MTAKTSSFLRREAVPAVLMMGSVVPALFLGYILDVALVHLYASYQNTGLPQITVPVYEALAGHRGLAQEIMLACWLGMAVWFVKQALSYTSSETFRSRFLMGFAVMWLAMLSIFLGILSACLAPSDILLARISDGYRGYAVLHAIIGFELLAVPVLAIKAIRVRKRERT
ncbi:MAG: hypothetical protein HY788_06965 [Deltaproteobacteria bacterium]|nr:hypothetical protein [Deltaproteobacteria bacterium]